MKLNLRNETLSIQTILQISYFSSSFIFIPQTNLDFPKKITLHARKTFLFFYKILSRFPSSFLSLRSFLFQPSSWLSPLIPFSLSLFHLHTHTYSNSPYWTCKRTFPARVTYNRVIPVGFLQARAAMPEESVVEPTRKLGRAYWRQFFEIML